MRRSLVIALAVIVVSVALVVGALAFSPSAPGSTSELLVLVEFFVGYFLVGFAAWWIIYRRGSKRWGLSVAIVGAVLLTLGYSILSFTLHWLGDWAGMPQAMLVLGSVCAQLLKED